jgi:predicted MarR family transcription regulator
MKIRTIIICLLAIVAFVGCYDDSELRESLNDHELRIKQLEQICNQINTNISSLQSAIEALQKNDYVTSTAPIKENGKEVGYTINFSSGKSITIYYGKDGQD